MVQNRCFFFIFTSIVNKIQNNENSQSRRHDTDHHIINLVPKSDIVNIIFHIALITRNG